MPEPKPKIEAVVFDLYKTLVHCQAETHPHRELFVDLGYSEDQITEARQVFMTHRFETFEDVGAYFAPGVKLNFARYRDHLELELASTVLYSEVRDVLDDLKGRGYQLGIISNISAPYTGIVKKLGLDKYFDREKIIFSCDAGYTKPNLVLYQRMIEIMQIDPAKIIMTGDQVRKDVEAPRVAGMQAVHLVRNRIVKNTISSLEGIFDYLR